MDKSYVLERSSDKAQSLRQSKLYLFIYLFSLKLTLIKLKLKLFIVIIDHVKRDPENFSDVILGRPREEYCFWIAQQNSWGGAIGKNHSINVN